MRWCWAGSFSSLTWLVLLALKIFLEDGMKQLSFLLLLVLGLVTNAAAQDSMSETTPASSGQRGLVTSGLCPLSCQDLMVPEASCKSWSAGEKCYVEDFRSPAGHRSVAKVRGRMGSQMPKSDSEMGQESAAANTAQSMNADSSMNGQSTTGRRGLVTSARCPYTCADAAVPAEDCREIQSGDTCSVEDFRQAPGHRSMIAVPN